MFRGTELLYLKSAINLRNLISGITEELLSIGMEMGR